MHTQKQWWKDTQKKDDVRLSHKLSLAAAMNIALWEWKRERHISWPLLFSTDKRSGKVTSKVKLSNWRNKEKYSEEMENWVRNSDKGDGRRFPTEKLETHMSWENTTQIQNGQPVSLLILSGTIPREKLLMAYEAKMLPKIPLWFEYNNYPCYKQTYTLLKPKWKWYSWLDITWYAMIQAHDISTHTSTHGFGKAMRENMLSKNRSFAEQFKCV